MKEKDELILCLKIVLGKTASAARNWINSAHQTAATTFAFSPVLIHGKRTNVKWALQNPGSFCLHIQLLQLGQPAVKHATVCWGIRISGIRNTYCTNLDPDPFLQEQLYTKILQIRKIPLKTRKVRHKNAWPKIFLYKRNPDPAK